MNDNIVWVDITNYQNCYNKAAVEDETGIEHNLSDYLGSSGVTEVGLRGAFK